MKRGLPLKSGDISLSSGSPLISVIIVTHNSNIFIPRLFTSLKQAMERYGNVEVVVVDNASTDNTVLKIEEESLRLGLREKVEIVKLSKNLGFANGINIGVKFATGDILFLLNSDTYVDYEALKAIAEAFVSDNRIGVAQCLLLQYFMPHRIDSCGDRVSKPLWVGMLSNYAEKLQDHATECLEVREIEIARGAAVALSRRLVNKVVRLNNGYLFPPYFRGSGYEDFYISLLSKVLGYKVILLPTCRVYHESLSSRRGSEYTVYNRIGTFVEFGLITPTILTVPLALADTILWRNVAYIIALVNTLRSLPGLMRKNKKYDPTTSLCERKSMHPSCWLKWYINYRRITSTFDRKYKKKLYALLEKL